MATRKLALRPWTVTPSRTRLAGYIAQGRKLLDEAPAGGCGTRRKVWTAIVQRLGGWAGVLAAFAVGYALLLWLGYQFKESDQQLTIMWPGCGAAVHGAVAFAARWWPAFLAMQVALELAVGAAMAGHFNPSPTLAPVFCPGQLDRCAGRRVGHAHVDCDQARWW